MKVFKDSYYGGVALLPIIRIGWRYSFSLAIGWLFWTFHFMSYPNGRKKNEPFKAERSDENNAPNKEKV
jgi:hypothetical protein